MVWLINQLIIEMAEHYALLVVNCTSHEVSSYL
jgi:hypothetical protein